MAYNILARPLYICTADADASVGKMEILYQFATTDHIPVNISIDVDHLPGLCDTGMSKDFNKGRLDWSNIDQSLKKTYHSQTEILLNDIYVQGKSFFYVEIQIVLIRPCC